MKYLVDLNILVYPSMLQLLTQNFPGCLYSCFLCKHIAACWQFNSSNVPFYVILLQSKANDGEGPELLRSGHDGGTSSHAESLAATLSEHRQHLDSIQVTKYY